MTNRATNLNDQWRQSLLSLGSSIEQAICNLDQSSLQIALLVTPEEVLVGTLTDGDIRRGLIRGCDLQSPVDTVVNRNPIVVPPELPKETVLKIMRANDVQQLPVVNEAHRVVGLHLLEKLATPAQRSNKMIIMAGGKGTRLRPLTDNCPKPLLHVGGKPMLEHILERAAYEGFYRFVIAIHYLGHMIEDYFEDGRRWQIEIEYLREEIPLGTAGALSLLEHRPTEPFIVTNGDVLTDIRYGEMIDFHHKYDAMATMAVRLHEWQNPFGVVNTKGIDIIDFEEKPIIRSNVNAGIYVLSPIALNELTPGEHCDMPLLFRRLKQHCSNIDSSREHSTIVYPIHEPWLDVGRESDFQKAQSSFYFDPHKK